jgi:hypothetical protein
MGGTMTRADDTVAKLQHAADGVPVLIPGAFEVRTGRVPARPPAAGGSTMTPHATAAVPDRERLEREREGGGAPSERRHPLRDDRT